MEKSIKENESEIEEHAAEIKSLPPKNKGRVIRLIKEMWPAYLIEIFVIILGISITLALEEWRDKSKEKDLEIVYEKNLLSDISADLQLFDYVITNTQHVLEKGNDLMGFIENPSTHNLSSSQFIVDLKTLLERPDFISSDASFSELKNSGNLHLLKDMPLKNLLFSYYSQTGYIKESQDAEGQATISITGPYFMKRFPLGNVEKQVSLVTDAGLQTLPKDIEFANNVRLRIGNREELLEKYKRAAALGDQIKAALHLALNDRQ
jgi:hypothetical protein